MKTLVIVESKGKIDAVSRYLNGLPELTDKFGRFTVIACFGHIRDLQKKTLSVDVENGFKPIFEILDDKKKTIADIGKHIKNHDFVLLASDDDSSGHAIAWHIQQYFKLKQYKRIVFN